MKNILLSTVAALTLFTLPHTAFAQLDIPSTADIGRSDETIQAPSFGSVNTPEINIPEVRVDNAPEGSDSIKFTLNSINLVGVSAYPVAELQQIWSDKIGTTITLTDVYAIAQQITRKYRNDGYIITQAVIPQQTIEGGNLEIQVVEGFIDGVSLQDAPTTFASERILSLAENLKNSRPLKSEDLERWLLLVNDIPGLNARSIISPSATAVGGADLVIIPTIDPYNFSLNLDNYGTRFIGPLQATAAVQFNNLMNAADNLQFQFATDPDDDERLYTFARYGLPVNKYGTSLGFDVTSSQTEPGFELEQFDVKGRTTEFGIDATHPIIRSRTQNLFGTLRFDYRDLSSTNIVDAFKTKDRTAAVRAGLDYSVYDTLWQPAVNEANITVSQGLDVLNANKKGDINMTRANGDPQFTKVEASLSRIQTITPQVSILTGVTGQWSDSPLLSSEEFGAGGRAFGRGYDASEIVGDDGFGATVEMRWKPEYETPLHDYELFTFYDFGKIWNQDTEVENLETQSIASAGVGLRTDFTEIVSGEFVVAQPLTKEVDVYDSKNTRFKFSLGADF